MCLLSPSLLLQVVLLLYALLPVKGAHIPYTPPALNLSVNAKQLQSIESYLDLNVNPCENFYAYACGNWAEHHTGGRYYETTGLIDHKVNKRFIDYFEAYKPTNIVDNIYNKIWFYYKSCKRTKQHTIIKYLQLVRPAPQLDWPLLQRLRDGDGEGNANATANSIVNWPKERFNWLLTLARLRRYDFSGTLIEHLVLQSPENATRHIIDLDKPTLEGRKKLPDLPTMVVLLVQLGMTQAHAIELAESLQQFEAALQQLHTVDDEYGLLELTVQDLQDDLPQLPWRRYFNTVLGYDIDGEYTLQLSSWAYFVGLEHFLAETDPELLCNYIMLRFLTHLTQDSASSFTKVDCMVDVRSKMDVAINYIYREHFFAANHDAYSAEVQRLLELVKQQFAQLFSTNTLQLQPAQLEFAQQKLSAMRMNIGNLPAHANISFVEAYYATAHFTLKNYYKNHLQLLQLRARQQHALLRAPLPPSAGSEYFFITDSDTARSSTPFYLVRKNVIIMPYGFLQPPIFHRHMHDIFKLSLLGFLLTHELVHGFDETGLVFDFAGNADEVGGGIGENGRYKAALQCLERSATTSIDERIADIVGVRLAYDTLFGATSTLRTQQPNFTQIPAKRLFFLNLAQFFCGNLGAEFMDHDSDNVRLQQTLLNFEPFAEEFQCKLGDFMHPELKCRLW